MKQVSISTLEDAIHITKGNGTSVEYFIFNEYEIHLNTIHANSIQEWHSHSKIEEVILVTKGELLLSWLEENVKKKKVIYQNQLVQVRKSIHTFSNVTDTETSFIVFRLILDGKDKREIIKGDKKVIDV